jgi:signal peptidase II
LNEETKTSFSLHKQYSLWIGLSSLVVAFDQLTKWPIVRWLRLGDIPIEVNSFLYIVRRHNEGAAWSFLADAGGWQRWFFIVLASTVSAYIVYWLWTIRNEGNTVLSGGLALVLGGAVGNLVDRIHYGHVIDFIDVYFARWNYHFPAFNVADSAITVGAVLLIVDALFISGRQTTGD